MNDRYTEKRAELIRYLSRLPFHDIYNLAPPQYVKRGFGYYWAGNLCNLEWMEDTLLAEVEGTFIYEVELRYSNGGLETGCNCPAFTSLTTCKHVICALISIKNILDPQAFKPSPFNVELRDYLLNILTMDIPSHGNQKKEQGTARLVLAPDKDDIYIRNSWDKPFYFDDTSYTLRNIRYNLLYGRVSKADIFKDDSGFILEYKGIEIPLTFKERTNFRPEILFKATKKHLSAELRFVHRNNHSEELILFKDILLIDPGRGCHYFLRGSKRKKIVFFFQNLHGSSHGNIFYRLPLKTDIKKGIVLSLDDTGADIIRKSLFIVDRMKTELLTVEPEYSINISPARNASTAGIELRVCTEDISLPFPLQLLEIIEQVWLGRFRALKGMDKRKRFFEDIIMTSGAVKSDRRQMAIRLMNHLKSGNKHISASTLQQYRSFVRHAVKYLSGEDYYFTYTSARWVLIKTAIRQCLDILSGIYCLLKPGDVVDIDSHKSTIHVKNDALCRILGQMHKLLTENGVNIYYDRKSLRRSNWDVTIDFHNEIDWFELKPEIKLNEKHLSAEELTKIAKSLRGRIAENGNFVEILPEKVLEVLKLIYPKEPGRSERKREIHRIPRLQILHLLSLRKKGINLKIPSEEEKIIKSLLNFQGIKPVRLPTNFRGTLRKYQEDAYYWLCFLYKHRFGACLADDMGLGKTVQTIVFLAALKEGILGNKQNTPHLIVVPPSLVFNWEAELRRFYPSFRVLTYTGTERKLDIEDTDILITTYAIMRRDINILKGVRFDVIVFDEAQAVKNIRAETTKAARKLNARFKMALTGTPVENHIGEYFSIIDLCLPGLMGEYDEFMRMYRQQNRNSLDDVIKRTTPFILRRTKEEILKELPGKVETDIYLDLTDKQKALYTRTVQEIKREIDTAYGTMTQAQAQVVVLSALMKLRRLCLSPALVEKTLPEESPKVDLLVERLELLMQQGHSALVFSQFTSYLDIVEKRLKKAGIEYLRLDGSTSLKKRKQLVKEFQHGDEQRVFLLSLKAGGQGINLTKATYVFHLDPWWNPAVEDQATDRTYRIGQKNKVTVIRLLMRHTIEEKMQELKGRKKALYNALLGVRQTAKGVKLTRQDIDYLLETA